MADPALVNPIEEEQRSKSRILLVIRSIFLIMLVTMVMLSLLKGGSKGASSAATEEQDSFFIEYWWIPLLIALVLGMVAISLDALTPRKKLSGISSIIFGLMAGLLATVAFSWIVDLLLEAHNVTFLSGSPGARIILAIKAAFAITLCYLGVSVVYTTQDEFRLIIPYVEFSKQIRGTRPLILDTSAIIDGRFNDIASTGFISAPVIIPRFVIHELQALSDSGDRLKRSRGRRGLDMIRKMQNNPHIDLGISDEDVPGAGVDQKLLIFAQQHKAHLVTTDFNLNKVASIHEVNVLNINDLANSLKPVAIPGEEIRIEIIKRGEGEGQGVGYLDDGTMVVVEHAASQIGNSIICAVTSSIQTSAGRMIFCEWHEGRRRVESHAPALTSSGRTEPPGSSDEYPPDVTSIPAAKWEDDPESADESSQSQHDQVAMVTKKTDSVSNADPADREDRQDHDEARDVVEEREILSSMQETALHGQPRAKASESHGKPRERKSPRNPRRSR